MEWSVRRAQSVDDLNDSVPPPWHRMGSPYGGYLKEQAISAVGWMYTSRPSCRLRSLDGSCHRHGESTVRPRSTEPGPFGYLNLGLRDREKREPYIAALGIR